MSAHVDWPRLLEEIAYLLGDPVPGAEHVHDPVGTPTLAKRLDRPRSTVLGWMDGKEPKHSDGEALIAVWCVLSGKASLFVPLAKPPLSASKMKAHR